MPLHIHVGRRFPASWWLVRPRWPVALVVGGAQPGQPPGPRGESAQSVSQIEPRPYPRPRSDDTPREASPEEGVRPPGPFRVVSEGASESLITDILHTREAGPAKLLGYGFGVEERRPLEGWLHGWRGVSAQWGRRHGSCTWRWGQVCPVCPPFHWPPRIPCPLCPHVRETRLTRHMGGHRLRAPPLREGVRETQSEHNKNHRSRGIIAKDQEDVQLFFHYQIVKKKNKKKTQKNQKNRTKPFRLRRGRSNTSCRCQTLRPP